MRGDRFDHLVKTIASRRMQRATGAAPPAGAIRREPARRMPHLSSLRAAQADAQACLPGDSACASDYACCSGVCTMHGRCGCFDRGHLCPGDGFCCSGVCREHRCR